MTDYPIRALCKILLRQGLESLDLALGIVSKIEGKDYHIFSVMPEDAVFKEAEVFALEDTYCRDVVESQSVIALTHLGGVQGLSKHPLYIGLPLEAYICAPIIVNGQVWGTLNFSSMKIRDLPFTEDDKAQMQAWACTIADKVIEESLTE